MKIDQLTKRLFFIIIVLLSAQSLKAGWIITGKFIDQEGRTIMQRYFIQDFKVKFEQYNIIYTFNLKTNSLILVDPVNMIYCQGTIESYIRGLKQQKNRQLENLIKDIPEIQKAEAREAYADQINRIGSPINLVIDSINIVRSDDSLVVFDNLTEKYLVSLNKRRTEETWISPALNINSEFNWDKYLYFLSVLEPENSSLKYMATKSYRQLLDKGFPVRRIMVVSGYKNEYQFSQLDEKKIPEYEFYTPSNCKELSIDEWLNRNRENEMKDDDYE
jgi:hypothetical protein